MSKLGLEATLAAFSELPGDSHLGDIRRGIERESLRIDRDGKLAETPHPSALGACLTHPQITTDFSEAQLELITGVHTGISDLLTELSEIHQFVYQHLENDETLWTASMPCLLGESDHIPVGEYGSSNIARLKTVYRLGLSLRYGKAMQTISGIHFNFSMSDKFWHKLQEIEKNNLNFTEYRTQKNFHLIRNFNRHAWLLLFLFGASPAICKTFPTNYGQNLEELDQWTLYRQYATCLRMGKLGYQSEAQSTLEVSFNSLSEYASSLHKALTEPYPPYEEKGIQSEDGNYNQLSTSLLQIENEFYSTIRPKCLGDSGERPLNILAKKGVEYIEVRLMDVNPFLQLGIDKNTILFLDVFLLHCLFTESPPDSSKEIQIQKENWQLVVENGRQPDLHLKSEKGEEKLTDLGADIFTNCMPVAKALDKIKGGNEYENIVISKRAQLNAPESTPSGRIITELKKNKIPFFRFAMNQSKEHRESFKTLVLPSKTEIEMKERAAQSHIDKEAVESSDDIEFEEFRKNYIEQKIYPKN